MNNGGSRKTISSAYGNVSGTRKQIYPYSATTSTTYYYWDRYELVTTGSVSTTSTGSYYIPISNGSFSLLYAYNLSCVGKDGTGLYLDYDDYGSECTWGDYFAIIEGEPDSSSGRIYAKDTYDGKIYYAQHNTRIGYIDGGNRAVRCNGSDTSDTCIYTVSYTITSYSKGTYIDEVSSTNATKYPSNNYSGSYWYVYDRSEVVYS